MPETTAPHPCAGPCGHRWRTAEATTAQTGIPHDIRPWYGQPYWCDHCRTRVLTALSDLPELIAAAHLQALYATPKQAERVTTSQAPAWPGQAARLLTDLLIGGLAEIEDAMRDLRSWSDRTAHYEPAVLNHAVTTLTLSIDWLLAEHPLAADPDLSPGAAILTWHRKAVTFTGRDKLVHRFPVRCPTCDLLALRREDGSSYVECSPRIGGCGRLWTEAEYLNLVTVAASDLKRPA